MENNLLSVLLKNISVNWLNASYVNEAHSCGMYDFTPNFSSIGYICEGDGAMLCNGVDVHPQAGDLYLMPANTLQSFYNINDTPYKKYFCHFTAHTAAGELFNTIKVPLLIHVENPSTVIHMFDEMCQAHNDVSATAPLFTHAYMELILGYYLSHADKIDLCMLHSEKYTMVEDALQYIDQHLGEDLSLAVLSQHFFFSPSHFTNAFKEVTGLSPKQYIIRRRDQEAVRLLQQTATSIANIAAATGFDNQFYFANTFKKMHGITPSEFRSIAREQI